MAVDMFLKLDGIKGESSDAKHKDTIHIESFSWGLSQTGSHGSGGGGGAGKASFQDFSFISRVNAASPLLALACASGQHIKSAVLTARKAGGSQEDYLEIKLSDLLVSSYQSAGDSGDPTGAQIPGTPSVLPEEPGEVVESFALNFTKIEFSYKPQRADGSLGAPVKMGWDIKANTKV